MKFLKTSNIDEECVLFIPETDDEKTFFSMDMALEITGLPPYSLMDNSHEICGWKVPINTTEEDMKEFILNLEKFLEDMYHQGFEQIINRQEKVLN